MGYASYFLCMNNEGNWEILQKGGVRQNGEAKFPISDLVYKKGTKINRLQETL